MAKLFAAYILGMTVLVFARELKGWKSYIPGLIAGVLLVLLRRI